MSGKLLLAVSGGVDSMYLAHRASEFYPGASFVVAHCNFQLRGEESDADQEFVRQWCSTRAMEFRSVKFDTEGFAAERGISLEMAARELRYSWFTSICSAEGCDAVVVAHNANDNAETLFLNLLRGTGSRGVRGMADRSVRADGLVILRPMLGISRKEIVSWMEAGGIKWREDRTNAENIAKRNILRNEVFPLLEKINPSFLTTVQEDMERLRQADDIAEDYFLSCGLGAASNEISADKLLALKHWKFVLWRLLENCHLNKQTFDKLTELLEKFKSYPRGTITMSGKTFESPTHIIRICGRKLSIVRRQD